MKEQDKTPKEKLSEDRQSPQERVQGKDHVNYQITQEKNGCTKKEIRSF